MTIDQAETSQLDPSPVDPAELQTSSSRRKIWLIRVAVLSAVALVIAAIGAFVWARNYQPLESGGWAGVKATGAQVVSIDNTFGSEYQVTRPRPNSTITANVGIWSDGHFPVTIESVGSPLFVAGSQMVGFVSKVAVSSYDDRSRPGYDLSRGPVVLQPGTTLYVSIRMTVADCNGRGGLTFEYVPVTYTALGITHTTHLPLGYAITLHQAPQCPAGSTQ